MKISKQARRDGKQLFRNCFVNGLLDDNRVRQTVKRLLESKPRGYMGILGHMQRLIKLDIERRTARVESATPLASDLQSNIESSLKRTHGSGLLITYIQNPTLLGGLRIQVGSDVYDGSVQARLAALQGSF